VRESTIEKYLRAEIAKLGGWMEKHTSPGRRGVPDNIVMWPAGHERNSLQLSGYPTTYSPTTEFIETKAPRGKLTVLQERDHECRMKMGFCVHVIWNMKQAEDYLRLRGKK